MQNLLEYIVNRLSEASTWRGLIAFATAAGIVVSPDQAEAIIAAGLAFIGVLGAFTRDK